MFATSTGSWRPTLVAGGARVVTVDLRGHGDSSADWPGYGMAETAADLMALLDHLDAGPAAVVATSFAPAAALWAAADRPDLIGRLVLISAHLDAAPIWQRIPLSLCCEAARGQALGRPVPQVASGGTRPPISTSRPPAGRHDGRPAATPGRPPRP